MPHAFTLVGSGPRGVLNVAPRAAGALVRDLAYTRYSFTCCCGCKNQSSLHWPRPFALPTLLQYYCTSFAQYKNPPPALPLYGVHYSLSAMTISCKFLRFEQQRRWYAAALRCLIYCIIKPCDTCIHITHKKCIFTRAAEALVRDSPTITYILYYFCIICSMHVYNAQDIYMHFERQRRWYATALI